jgi:hypothetical protein
VNENNPGYEEIRQIERFVEGLPLEAIRAGGEALELAVSGTDMSWFDADLGGHAVKKVVGSVLLASYKGGHRLRTLGCKSR